VITTSKLGALIMIIVIGFIYIGKGLSFLNNNNKKIMKLLLDNVEDK
jgi:hypothetical protein